MWTLYNAFVYVLIFSECLDTALWCSVKHRSKRLTVCIVLFIWCVKDNISFSFDIELFLSLTHPQIRTQRHKGLLRLAQPDTSGKPLRSPHATVIEIAHQSMNSFPFLTLSSWSAHQLRSSVCRGRQQRQIGSYLGKQNINKQQRGNASTFRQEKSHRS